MPLGKVLCNAVFVTVLCKTIVPLDKVVCDTVLSFWFDVEGYGKGV